MAIAAVAGVALLIYMVICNAVDKKRGIADAHEAADSSDSSGPGEQECSCFENSSDEAEDNCNAKYRVSDSSDN